MNIEQKIDAIEQWITAQRTHIEHEGDWREIWDVCTSAIAALEGQFNAMVKRRQSYIQLGLTIRLDSVEHELHHIAVNLGVCVEQVKHD